LLEDVEPVTVLGLVFAFRKDLNLEFAHDLTGSDLEAVDKLLSAGFARRGTLISVKHLVEELYFRLSSRLIGSEDVIEKDDEKFVFYESEGQLNGIAFECTYLGIIRFVVTTEYPEQDDFSSLEVTLSLDNREAPTDTRRRTDAVARERGFQFHEDEYDGEDFLPPSKDFVLKCRRTKADERKISGNNTINAIDEEIGSILAVVDSR
jgi:hypothetical protein